MYNIIDLLIESQQECVLDSPDKPCLCTDIGTSSDCQGAVTRDMASDNLVINVKPLKTDFKDPSKTKCFTVVQPTNLEFVSTDSPPADTRDIDSYFKLLN